MAWGRLSTRVAPASPCCARMRAALAPSLPAASTRLKALGPTFRNATRTSSPWWAA